MMRLIMALLIIFIGSQSANAMNIDALLDKHVAPISNFVSDIIFFPVTIGGTSIPLVILWILFGGVFFALYLRGIAIWGLPESFRILKTPAQKNTDGGGEVSPLQSLMTALSGTIGLGSIAGVAISISIGGPGAVFWMFIGAILGMALKFVEAALAIKVVFLTSRVPSSINEIAPPRPVPEVDNSSKAQQLLALSSNNHYPYYLQFYV